MLFVLADITKSDVPETSVVRMTHLPHCSHAHEAKQQYVPVHLDVLSLSPRSLCSRVRLCCVQISHVHDYKTNFMKTPKLDMTALRVCCVVLRDCFMVFTCCLSVCSTDLSPISVLLDRSRQRPMANQRTKQQPQQ